MYLRGEGKAITFTYTLSTAIGKIRLEINDTNSAAAKLTDEEIQYAIDQTSSLGGAVVYSIQLLMAQLTDPDFQADWLRVDASTAYKSLESLLATKRQQFGVAAAVATTGFAWRPDSGQTAAPTFETEDDDE